MPVKFSKALYEKHKDYIYAHSGAHQVHRGDPRFSQDVVIEHPHKSNREMAKELGLDEETVSAMRMMVYLEALSLEDWDEARKFMQGTSAEYAKNRTEEMDSKT